MGNNNSNSRTDSNATNVVACRVCFEHIKEGASKCIHCGSYQDWSRHILRWTTILISTLGIVPLWGIATSLQQLAFSPKVANIEAAITSCEKSQIIVAFANSGKLDGIVTKVHLDLVYKDKVVTPDYKMRATDRASSIVVSPNSAPDLVTYKAYVSDTENLFTSDKDNHPSCSFRVKVDWVDFKGSRKQLYRTCECP